MDCNFKCPDTALNKENIDCNRVAAAEAPGRTPARPRLGKFVDVYSPEHLNVTPKNKQKLEFNANRNESPDPDWYTNEYYRRRQNQCRSVKARPPVCHVLSECSFEGNQSFPRLSRKVRPIKMELETPTKTKQAADYVRVDGPNGLRFNTSLATVESAGSPGQSQTERLQQTVNSSKAVFTIEPNSTKILIVNNKACSLLGYSSGELCGMSFSELLHSRSNRTFKLQEPEDPDSSEERPVVLLSGKVVELLCRGGGAVQVSLWIRQLDSDGPCLVVAEPVRCISVKLLVEAESGLVVWGGGEQAALLFCAEGEPLAGLPAPRLVPSIRLPPPRAPDRIYKQKATGRTLDGSSFPLCLWISKADSADLSVVPSKYKDKTILEVNIRVTYNVSGLLVVDESGVVTACNPHFALLTFGAPLSDVLGQPVGRLLPGFCRAARRLPPAPAPPGSDTEDESCSALHGSQRSARACGRVAASRLSAARDGSSSALCLDKSCSLVTHTPTPTQDMVSSISTTEQRNDLSALPDLTSGMSGVSMDDDAYCPSLSKSRSENMLRSEQSHALRSAKPSEQSDSIYYTWQHSQEVTPTGAAPRARVADPSLRLSFDSSKFKAFKNNAGAREDRSSVSFELCDSNETSADFLTPINEMPPAGDLPLPAGDLPPLNGAGADSFYDNDADTHTHTESVPRNKYEEKPETPPCVAKRLLRNHITTSTPQKRDCDCGGDCAGDCGADCARDGTYAGTLLHRDGTELDVVYSVSTVALGTGARVRCVWVRVRAPGPPTRAPSHASTADDDLATGNKSASSRPASMSLASQCGEEQAHGEYSRHYVTLKQIGKGAYGCVKMAYRRSDRLLAVAKFILKEKVGAQFWVDAPDGRRVPLELSLLLTLDHPHIFWVDAPDGRRVPLELSLLLTLDHPHIVSVLDAFENEKYFQMVMEKHGAGMDLFEFIERRPRLDEPLLSYIFRQIGQAVEYLHGLHILHRDIKDENVIIDSRFHVKLIDFGSATFMARDALFSTFYGTTEYCSPEVLAGNKYAGPELEMWSMGITLYVLTFFVNPFADIEDTIQGPLTLPHPVSDELEHLLRWMLHKEPSARCTVPQLMAHAWTTQPVSIHHYSFPDVVDCDEHEANPELYYSGSPDSARSGSPVSLAEHHTKDEHEANPELYYSGSPDSARSGSPVSLAEHHTKDEHEANPELYYSGSPDSARSGSPVSLAEHHTKESWRSRECGARGSAGPGGAGGPRGARAPAPPPPPDPASDNYSLRSSADILDISSKPVSEAALTDISSDATGHAACDIACDCGREHACDCGRDHAPADDAPNDSWASDIVDQDSFS